MSRDKKDGRSDLAKGFALMSQIGFTIIACIAAGVFLGNWLDGLLGTSPWLLILFAFFGMGAAFKSIVDLGKRG